MRALLLVMCLHLAGVAFGDENIYYDTANRIGVDPILLQSVVKVESGGYPWTINVDGEPIIFATKSDLLSGYRWISEHPYLVRTYRNRAWHRHWFATLHDAETYFVTERDADRVSRLPRKLQTSIRRVNPINTDFGVMQINWRQHHRAAGDNIERLVDPRFNLEFGCRLLAGLIGRYGTWQGIARYHSATPALQIKYQKRIWVAYQQIKAITARNIDLATGTTY